MGKLIRVIATVLSICTMFMCTASLAFASEEISVSQDAVSTSPNYRVIVGSPETVAKQLADLKTQNNDSDIQPYMDIIDDIVTVTFTIQPNGGIHIVVMNEGFMFDTIDRVTGYVRFFLDGRRVSVVRIDESQLKWHQARPYDAYPAGGEFDTVKTEITITDGGESQTLTAEATRDEL